MTRLTCQYVADIWSRCSARLDELDRAKRIEGFVGKYAWGICGVFLVAIALGGFFNRAWVKSVRSEEVAGYVSSMSPVPVSNSRSQSDLDPAVRQVLGESFNSRPPEIRVTALGTQEIPGNRATVVVLDDGYGALAVFALHDVRQVSGLYDYEQDSDYKCGQINGSNALFWSRPDGVICMAVGTRSFGDIYRIVRSLGN